MSACFEGIPYSSNTFNQGAQIAQKTRKKSLKAF